MFDEQTARTMLTSFVNDPPDSDYQRGFLAAVLVITNEHMDVRYNDPLWQKADALLNGDVSEAIQTAVAKKTTTLSIIKGGRED